MVFTRGVWQRLVVPRYVKRDMRSKAAEFHPRSKPAHLASRTSSSSLLSASASSSSASRSALRWRFSLDR